tara:strand:+ start:176 stop:412 length:237 start_codon:yes stop_codon:yes gene_type:complete
MDSNLENKIKGIFSSVLGVPKDEILMTSSSETIKSWDSLNHINLIFALEEEFNIEFSDEQIHDLTNFKSASDAIFSLI